MEQLLWIVLLFSLILLIFSIGYLINNLIFTVKLLLKTFTRLEQTVDKVEELANYGQKVYTRYQEPLATVSLATKKITSLMTKIKHKK